MHEPRTLSEPALSEPGRSNFPSSGFPSRDAARTLALDAADRERLVAWTLADLPREACGLLIGRESDGGALVVEVARARNLETTLAADRFEVDPADLLAAEQRARSLGLAVVGCWHSHPESPGRPSRTDRERAWPGWSYAIVGLAPDGGREVRSWRLAGAPDAEVFVEERVEPSDAARGRRVERRTA